MRRTQGSMGAAHLECVNPIKNKWHVRFDFKEDEDGQVSYMEEEFKGKPSISEVKDVIVKYYNDLCDEEIRSGLMFEGNQVWLSTENQFNYKSAFDFAFQTVASGGDFIPVTVKLGTDEEPVYRTFEDIAELQAFITTCFAHIQGTLAKYWAIKDSTDFTKYQ